MTSNSAPFYALPLLLTAITIDCMACWNHVPLERIIDNAHVVVIGGVDRIELADPPPQADEHGTDTAYIVVSNVLKNTLSDYSISANDELPLSMPSVLNKVHFSTDIRFKEGQMGIWILRFRNGFFTASYPKDFQPLSSKQRVVNIINNIPDAYERGLAYLASTQNPDGSWGGATGTVYETAFALLAFLNNGTMPGCPDFGANVREGLIWMLHRNPTGSLERVSHVHVLSVAYQLSCIPIVRDSARRHMEQIDPNELEGAYAALFAVTPRQGISTNEPISAYALLKDFHSSTSCTSPLAIYLGGLAVALNDATELKAFNLNMLRPLLMSQKEDGSFRLANAKSPIESTSFALLYLSVYYRRLFWLSYLNSAVPNQDLINDVPPCLHDDSASITFD